MNHVVGDYFKLKLEYMKYVDMALELIKWIMNHSLALGHLKAQQTLSRARVLVLILPVLTRWTSHYLAIRRLLDLRNFIVAMIEADFDFLVSAAGQRRELKMKATEVLRYALDSSFWRALQR